MSTHIILYKNIICKKLSKTIDFNYFFRILLGLSFVLFFVPMFAIGKIWWRALDFGWITRTSDAKFWTQEFIRNTDNAYVRMIIRNFYLVYKYAQIRTMVYSLKNVSYYLLNEFAMNIEFSVFNAIKCSNFKVYNL